MQIETSCYTEVVRDSGLMHGNGVFNLSSSGRST